MILKKLQKRVLRETPPTAKDATPIPSTLRYLVLDP
jgi:hypothetical protein